MLTVELVIPYFVYPNNDPINDKNMIDVFFKIIQFSGKVWTLLVLRNSDIKCMVKHKHFLCNDTLFSSPHTQRR
jgi:hypothetical protein